MKAIFLSILLFFSFTDSQSTIVKNKYSKIEIIPEKILKKNGYYLFGIKLLLNEGWKTYWKNPGEAGASISANWVDNSGILETEILFPFPKKYLDHGVTTIGYDKKVVFPVLIKLEPEQKEINKELVINYLICKEICIPLTEKLNVNFSIDDSSAIKFDDQISQYLKKIPKIDSGIFQIDEIIKVNEKKIQILFKFGDYFRNNYEMFSFSKDSNSRLELVQTHERLSAFIDFDENINEIKTPILISISDGKNLEEIQINKEDIKTKSSLIYFLLLAFIGGLILNFMPCVLPVLSLKLYSLVKISESQANNIRKYSFASFLGIIFSFILLSLIIILFKVIGTDLGWGFQFQNFGFLLFVSCIIFIFCINLLGFFEILLPSTLSNKLNSYASEQSFRSYFLSGVFSTLMATPCSAPFLGTAIGFSITSSYQNIIIIFIFISFGFALPYIISSVRPSLVSILPKPGKWMENFKLILGLILLITFGWFLSLMNFNAFTIITLTFIILLYFIFLKRNQFSIITSVVCLTIISYFLIPSSKDSLVWEKFDETLLNKQIENGDLILLDFTASWCVTCQVNKITTLDSKKLKDFIIQNNVKIMRGDWSKRDKDILEFISKYGRFGIPVNIVFGPRDGKGVILPEILSKDIVINQLNLIK